VKKWIFSILVIIALALLPGVALADSTVTPPPGWSGSYAVASTDGQYLLVILDGIYEPPGKDVSPETDALNKLLLKYPTSGLYRNDGSTTPLWTAEYISWKTGVTLSSDGHHMVVWRGWPSDSTYNDTALTFYEDGRLLRSYRVKDLVVYPEDLPHSASHYQWVLDSSLDDARGLLTVEALTHEKYVFALSTGQPISNSIPSVRERPPGRKVVPVSTIVIREADTPATNTRREDHTMAMGLLLSGGGLGTLFAGVSILSRKARRKRRSDVYLGVYTPLPAPPALRLKSRARGSKVALRRLRASARKRAL
jgi:hypothetical protein